MKRNFTIKTTKKLPKIAVFPTHKFKEVEIKPGIGFIAPFDFALDAECWRWMPKDVSLYITRTPYVENTAVTVDLAKEVSDDKAIETAVRSIAAVKPASYAYACTSGSFVGGISGEQHLQDTMMTAGAPSAVTTSGALIMALKHLQIKKLAVATPYNESLTLLLNYFLRDFEIEVVSNGYLNKEEGIARLGYDAVKELVKVVNRSDADAIFLSCTNLRTYDIIEELELLLKKPVLSANQVTIWAALQSAGLEMPDIQQQLFQKSKKASPNINLPLEDIAIENPVSELASKDSLQSAIKKLKE